MITGMKEPAGQAAEAVQTIEAVQVTGMIITMKAAAAAAAQAARMDAAVLVLPLLNLRGKAVRVHPQRRARRKGHPQAHAVVTKAKDKQ